MLSFDDVLRSPVLVSSLMSVAFMVSSYWFSLYLWELTIRLHDSDGFLIHILSLQIPFPQPLSREGK